MPIYVHRNVEYAILQQDEKGRWLEPFIVSRIKRNMNFIAMFSGRPRTGKSNSCLRLAEILHEDYGLPFDGLDNIAMGTLEFLQILKRRPPHGSVIVYEEAPVGHNTRKWYTKENEMLNSILNTFGFMRYVILLNGVNFSDLDSQARKLIHMRIKCWGISNGKVNATPQWVMYTDDERAKPFFISLRSTTGEVIRKIRFGRPNRELWKAYEKKKFEWNFKNLESMINEAKLIYGELQEHVISYEEIKKQVMGLPDLYKLITRSGKISANKLSAYFNLQPSMAKKYATKLNFEDIDWKIIADERAYKELKKSFKIKPATTDSGSKESENRTSSKYMMPGNGTQEKGGVLHYYNNGAGSLNGGVEWKPRIVKRLGQPSEKEM